MLICIILLQFISAIVAAEYAELHCHSSFSFLDGASNPEELIFWAKQLGLAALAITDHDDLGGVVRFAHIAKELSVEAIIGAELSLDDGSHITLLASDIDGYKNLCHLITHARNACERGSPRVAVSLLSERSKGLVALSGCPHGRLAQHLAKDDMKAASLALHELHQIFKDNLYIEIWNHGLHQEAKIAKSLVSLSHATSIPWVVTNNVHYARPEKRSFMMF